MNSKDSPLVDSQHTNNSLTNLESGLDDKTVASLQQQHGPNAIQSSKPDPWYKKLLKQFQSLVILILVIAAVLSGFLGEWVEASAILVIVTINGLIGFIQEYKAEKSLEGLKKMTVQTAKVLRNGTRVNIAASELVPGDIIFLEAGDLIPADAKLVQAYHLKTQEAALTGESSAVVKELGSYTSTDRPLAERLHEVFCGTLVQTGSGVAVVTAIGMKTEIGKIAKLLKSSQSDKTPLEKRLEELGRIMAGMCLLLVSIVFCLQWLRQEDLVETFLFSVSLAVAVVPEGLPAVVTIALALGLQRLASRNALIRHLPSVETLGSVSIICSDKTGTLTRNEMTVTRLEFINRSIKVTGAGYAPQGQLIDAQQGKALEQKQLGSLSLDFALDIAHYCNTASLVHDEQGHWSIQGDPTEAALLTLALKGHHKQAKDLEVLDQNPFDSERKMMSILLKKNSKTFLYCKGAPEVIISKSKRILIDDEIRDLDEHYKNKLLELNSSMASDALRVLALAIKLPEEDNTLDPSEAKLIMVALVGMIDPPRSEVIEAVKTCKLAGIRPVMITGDHPKTACAIAQTLSISDGKTAMITGKELDQLSDQDLSREIERIRVYARTTAAHKMRIVNAWKSKNQVVAMTGDGVNDAPAIKNADIGIAMGITGTEVTKNASDMILIDDNFTSIVNAVEEGRGIMANIQSILHFLLSGNASEILFILIAVLLGWPTPLLAIQILWINLITDGLPALALATEKPDKSLMHQPPRAIKEPLFTRQRSQLISLHGALLALTMVISFYLAYYINPSSQGDLTYAQALTFGICSLSQLFFSISCRNLKKPVLSMGLFSNKALNLAIVSSLILQLMIMCLPNLQQYFFKQAPDYDSVFWMYLFTVSLLPMALVECLKYLSQRKFK